MMLGNSKVNSKIEEVKYQVKEQTWTRFLENTQWHFSHTHQIEPLRGEELHAYFFNVPIIPV